MFADDDATPAAAPAAAALTASASAVAPDSSQEMAASVSGRQQPAAAMATAAPASIQEEAVDYGAWPLSELKRLLTEAGVDFVGCVDKDGLAEKARALDAERAARAVPAGFVLDPASGYFVNADTAWYYHADSGMFFRDGKWFAANTTSGELLEVPAA